MRICARAPFRAYDVKSLEHGDPSDAIEERSTSSPRFSESLDRLDRHRVRCVRPGGKPERHGGNAIHRQRLDDGHGVVERRRDSRTSARQARARRAALPAGARAGGERRPESRGNHHDLRRHSLDRRRFGSGAVGHDLQRLGSGSARRLSPGRLRRAHAQEPPD